MVGHGRTHLALARAAEAPEPDPTHLAQATDQLDRAATRDLDEALEIAERGGMRLHLTDAHLERVRLRVSLGRTDEAREDLEAARTLVEETGYHRRDPEVAALTGELGDAGPPGDNEM